MTGLTDAERIARYGTCGWCGSPHDARWVNAGDGDWRWEMFCTSKCGTLWTQPQAVRP